MAKVTQEQLMRTAEQLFAQIDKNDNGVLEEEEVHEFARRMLEQVKPDAEFDLEASKENFRNMDKNHDGTVSKQELFQSLVDKAKAAHAI